MEAQVDLRNLLAEGYQPFLTSDGSRLYFAQAQTLHSGRAGVYLLSDVVMRYETNSGSV